jgi:hypothetical protein
VTLLTTVPSVPVIMGDTMRRWSVPSFPKVSRTVPAILKVSRKVSRGSRSPGHFPGRSKTGESDITQDACSTITDWPFEALNSRAACSMAAFSPCSLHSSRRTFTSDRTLSRGGMAPPEAS